MVEGTDLGLAGTLSLGPPFAGPEAPSVSVMNPAGGGVSAWVSTAPGGTPAVAVREDFPDGAVQTALVGGGAGGPIGELAVGRSGLGDGLIAFQQGALGDAAIVVAEATTPPAQLILTAPKGWIKPSQAQLAWAPAISANGPLRYTVVLDGRPLPTPAGAFASTIDPDRLGDGAHRLQLLATDIDGQATLSPPYTLSIDGSPPAVKITRAQGGYGVSVRVRDSYSGVDVHAIGVSFGDGANAHGRARFSHRYAHGGIYRVVVHVRDKIGNEGVARELVSVR